MNEPVHFDLSLLRHMTGLCQGTAWYSGDNNEELPCPYCEEAAK